MILCFRDEETGKMLSNDYFGGNGGEGTGVKKNRNITGVRKFIYVMIAGSVVVFSERVR